MAVKFLDGKGAEQESANKGVTVVNVFATWCGPCQMMGPVFDELSEAHNVVKVDSDQNKEWAREHGVSGLPTTFIYKDGKVVDTLVGFIPKEVLEGKINAV